MRAALPVALVAAAIGVISGLASRRFMQRATGPDIDRGEAIRFVAELPWNPDAILSASGLVWREIDARTVSVSTATAGGMAKVALEFDPVGDVVAVSATDRSREVGGTRVPTDRRGRFAG